jgi:hypothetical protein
LTQRTQQPTGPSSKGYADHNRLQSCISAEARLTRIQ